MHTTLTIKVVTASGRQQAVLDKSGAIKIYLKSTPEKGKANQELINFLAKVFSVYCSDITIIKGATSRTKTVKISSNLTTEQLLNKLV